MITQTKIEQDPEILAQRRALAKEKTPAQLAQISSLAEMPIPTALENFLKSDHKSRDGPGSEPRKPLSQ